MFILFKLQLSNFCLRHIQPKLVCYHGVRNVELTSYLTDSTLTQVKCIKVKRTDLTQLYNCTKE